MMRFLSWPLFVGLVVAANILTSRYGFVLGLCTAGTFAAGLTFAVRDLLHETAGRPWVVSAILAGAAVSLAWAAPVWRIAAASCCAFLLGELADYAIYAPLRRRSVGGAMLLSNTVGALVDSALFLALVGWFTWGDVGTQTLVKVAVTLPIIVMTVALARRRRPAMA